MKTKPVNLIILGYYLTKTSNRTVAFNGGVSSSNHRTKQEMIMINEENLHDQRKAKYSKTIFQSSSTLTGELEAVNTRSHLKGLKIFVGFAL